MSKATYVIDEVVVVIKALRDLFQTFPEVELLNLIRIIINADKKFESSKRQHEDVLEKEENIKYIETNQPIALPYYEPAPIIAQYGPNQMTDEADQSRYTEKNYYYEDNAIVAEYMETPFKTRKR